MRRLLPLAVPCALLVGVLLATPAAAGPRLVRITLSPIVPIERVLAAGLDVTAAHGGAFVDVLEWPGDAAAIAALGAQVTVLDDDPGLHAAERAREELASRPAPAERAVRSAVRPDGAFRTEALPPLGSGSLGGHWTLAEVKTKLDDLVASDTLGLVADKLDTLGYSLQGRPIWGLKLGTAVAGTDTRPVAYFNALTHAREPNGMEALFYFVDDLLAHYGSDPVATYLLQNRQIYLCPVVNPDGYWYNQRIYDSTATFGLWRKNLRDNDNSHTTNSSDGVDINRNFGFRWGYDNVGSSGSASSETYRGTAAWSEPETRVQRDAFVTQHAASGFSFHTYSGLFVHPWGYANTPPLDSLKFQTWDDELTPTNGFLAGQGPRVLYAVNGEFSDWAYGDTLLKARAFTWTPEVGFGDDGFWPLPSRIVPIAQSVLAPCYTIAGIAGPWVRVAQATVTEGYLNAGQTAHLVVRARNIGASGAAGPGLQATLTAVEPEVAAAPDPVTYATLGSFQVADPDGGAAFTIAAADSLTPGRMVHFVVDFTDAAGLHCRDTVEVVVGTPTVALLEPCNATSAWTVSGGWGVKTNDPNHPDAYLTDSPTGNYPNNANLQLTLKSTLDFSHGVHAWAFFEDRWCFEQEYDGALCEVSLDGTTWTALGGNGSIASPSTNAAGVGKAIFGGSRYRWRNDRVDLSSVAGPTATAVHLRFRTVSDAGTTFDGLAFDSLRVLVYDPAAQPAPVAVAPGPRPARLELAPPAPNPARGAVRFAFATPEAGPVALDVLDVHGRRVYGRQATVARGADGGPYAARFEWGWDLRDDLGRRVPPGVYLARLRTRAQAVVRRVVVLE